MQNIKILGELATDIFFLSHFSIYFLSGGCIPETVIYSDFMH